MLLLLSSTIDLIFTNDLNIHNESGVLPITVSDHYMTYTVICSKIINTKHDGEKYVTFRSYKHFSIEKFTALLLEGFRFFYICR